MTEFVVEAGENVTGKRTQGAGADAVSARGITSGGGTVSLCTATIDA